MAEHLFALTEDSFPDFRADDVLVKPASEAWEKSEYFALRRRVFSEEQQLLPQDKDENDFRAIPIVALACQCGMPNAVVGAVRIYQSEPGLWWGGRLCVAADYRRNGLIGTALINEAVSRAKGIGCNRFQATVQLCNETYFQRLHWQTLDHIELLGQPHAVMQVELQYYPFMPREISLLPLRARRHG
ncbi:MSMEG_0567/Sll0786 family nitrogen starvation N-acetyltransferase [Pseudomonas sp. OIL-1]|uniref:MSMEG_0567/Sll0786 family nitrogen starvation N-acetyltransferase n=1 Tax=Pseudomonas sp. OIL-1 TaxID=2706126 RepID=UPI0013A79329|nr:MSMEG_0567/Sll0786 family nitrogen starvation N-acetyltransferase [Pseudomonas sp. OIL-1]QIB50717.1 GNAT family N-acetyltransferase [Pseudomonas sp. OIL-1]